MTQDAIGVVESVYVCPPYTRVSRPAPILHCVSRGIMGDRHYGATRVTGKRDKVNGFVVGTVVPNDRQWSMLSLEELAIIAGNLGVPEVLPEDVGANIVISGIPNLTKLPAGTRYRIGPAELLSAGENLPCRPGGEAMAERYGNPVLAAHFAKSAIGLRGHVGSVRFAGTIMPGDQVRVYMP